MEYIRTFVREFPVGAKADLSIENRSGTVTVRGDETERVRVEVVARLWAESDEEADDQADLIDRGIRQEAGGVTVRAPTLARHGLLAIFGRGPRIDYQVSAPQTIKAQVTNRTGLVEIENLAGALEAEVRTGRMRVRRIAADVTISSRSGAIDVEAIEGSLDVRSRTGVVRVRRCNGNVTVQNRTGLIRIEDVGGELKVAARTGAVRYDGAVRGAFDIDVRTGSIRLAVDSSSVFFLDAESVTGAVSSDLSLRRNSQRETGERGPTVRLRTRTGSIRIVPR